MSHWPPSHAITACAIAYPPLPVLFTLKYIFCCADGVWKGGDHQGAGRVLQGPLRAGSQEGHGSGAIPFNMTPAFLPLTCRQMVVG